MRAGCGQHWTRLKFWRFNLRTNSGTAIKGGPETLLKQRPALTTTKGEFRMDDKALPTPDQLRQLLRYEPETGKLFWLRRGVLLFSDGHRSANRAQKIWNTRYAEREAFTYKNSNNYLTGRIHDRGHYAHRVIWAIVRDAWPDGEIDHISGDRTDNRIVNLRYVGHGINQQNMCRSRANTSGTTGISWDEGRKRWRVVISVGAKAVHLGRYTAREDAERARHEAEIIHGYHPNHGRERR